MEQKRLLYNVVSDTWAFSKGLKTKSEMTEEDWESLVKDIDSLCEKYRAVGERESQLMFKILVSISEYIEHEDQKRINADGKILWVQNDRIKVNS